MSINPISSLAPLESLEKTGTRVGGGQAVGGAEIPFQSLFENALGDVKEADATVQEETYRLVTGQTDDLHNLTIASTKLTLATDLFIQLRNKTLDAYNEIMRMNI